MPRNNPVPRTLCSLYPSVKKTFLLKTPGAKWIKSYKSLILRWDLYPTFVYSCRIFVQVNQDNVLKPKKINAARASENRTNHAFHFLKPHLDMASSYYHAFDDDGWPSWGCFPFRSALNSSSGKGMSSICGDSGLSSMGMSSKEPALLAYPQLPSGNLVV